MDKKILPKFHETFNPILDVLKDGEIVHYREMVKRVVEKYYSDLPKNEVEKTTKSGRLLINDRIAWGKSYLKKGGYISYPSRGMVKITEKGKAAIHENLTLKKVQSEDGIFNFYKEEDIKIKSEDDIITSTPQDLIDEGITQVERQIKGELLEKLKEIDPFYFEKVILILLNRMGYGEFIETKKTGDGGIDGIINEDMLGLDKIYIQAKRYDKNKIREKDIRNFIGAMSGDTRKGVFVTTSEFDSGAIKKAKEAHHSIILIDGFKLVNLLHQYNVGVQVKETYEVKEIDGEFFEGE